MGFYTLRNRTSTKNQNDRNNEKLLATLEIVALVFLTTFIPALIKLGRPPTSIAEIWVEILVALLASLYTYARVRSIDLEGPKE